MDHPKQLFLTALIALLLGLGIATWWHSYSTKSREASESGEKIPIYWVAPMDSNYRRDKPGKSPMGMDLVPVYAEDDTAADNPGAVSIAAHVINNLSVKTEPVIYGQLQQTTQTVGYVQFDENQLVHIHPRVDGWIEKLFVKSAGDPIKKGQAIYTLYSPELVNAQEEFLIALRRKNQGLIQAAEDRLKALQLTDQFIDALKESGEIKKYITFYSPQSGVVNYLKIREGFFVNPSNTLLSIGQLERVWIEAEIFERDAGRIRAGLKASVTTEYYPKQQWHGQIDYVYPSLNPKTRTLRARVALENPEGLLKPNMFVSVFIKGDVLKPRLLVPASAVIRLENQTRVVLALSNGSFKSIAVELGQSGFQEKKPEQGEPDADSIHDIDHRYFEVLSGLEENDRVVTSAQFLIDSESSKNSDFRRMQMANARHDHESSTVYMQGIINSKAIDDSRLNITHEPVPEWDWPEMTMDFQVDKAIDIADFADNQTIRFRVEKLESGQYQINEIELLGPAVYDSATVAGRINTIDLNSMQLNITREAIAKWNRPAATMDFLLSDEIHSDKIKDLQVGQTIHFTFEVRGDLVIVNFEIMPESNLQPLQEIQP